MVRDAELRAAHHHNVVNNNINTRRNKSKSTEDMNRENGEYILYLNDFFLILVYTQVFNLRYYNFNLNITLP